MKTNNNMRDKSGKGMNNSDAATILRYIATFEKDPLIRVNDSLSKIFLNKREKFLVEQPLLRKFMLKSIGRNAPGLYEFIVARTIHFDKSINELITKYSIKQLVILGAGFDSRAYRFSDRLIERNIQVFELDLPNVQEKKLAMLKNEFGDKCSNVRFIPADLDRGDIRELLLKSGYKPDQQTIILWEGVTPYLKKESIDVILNFVSHNSATNSILLFDFVSYGFLNGNASRYYGGKELYNSLVKRNAMMMSGIDETKLCELFNGLNLKLIGYWSPEDMQKQYLTKSDGTLLGRVTGYNHFATAQVI